MRSLLSKITAVAAVAFMMLGLLAVPAEAQDYPAGAPGAVDCDSVGGASVAIVGTDVVATFANGTLTCSNRVVMGINPVLYDGPPPVGDVLTRPIPALDGDDHTATVTVYLTNGTQSSNGVKIPPEALAAARANFAASGLPGSASVPAAGAAGAAVPVPAQNLAFTGSTVNLPLAAGALLVGAGGLTLLAARKREQNA